MTQHWVDIKNANVVMLIGSNAAENHPMSFKWIQKAIDNGATLINVDPRYCRSSSKAHIHAFMRSGTDIAFIGGMIKYAIDKWESEGTGINEKYLKECTNALFQVDENFRTCEGNTDKGVFSGLDCTGAQYIYGNKVNCKYDKDTWKYCVNGGKPVIAPDLLTRHSDYPNCPTVFELLREQFIEYTKENVCAITGTDPDVYEQICEKFCDTCADNKSATIMYAMGTTQHTVGTQNVRSYAILQLLMGNIGVAGGGINALRGQDNVQGSTDMCILQHILPGYIKCPTGLDVDLDAFINGWHHAGMVIEPDHSYTVKGTTGVDPTSAYWWQHGKKYMVSLIKAWWPQDDHISKGYMRLPKRVSDKDYSMLSMFDAMYNGDINGAIFDGENPAVSDPDSNHVRAALKNLGKNSPTGKGWLVCIDPFESETAAFWRLDPSGTNTTVYLLPAAIAYERAGSRSNSGRWAQWHWKGCDPPGYKTDLDAVPPGGAKDDLEILTLLGLRIQAKVGTSGVYHYPISRLNWPYFNYSSSDGAQARAEKVAKEVNGYTLKDTDSDTIPDTPDKLVASFGGLKDDGTTCSGNWLYCNQFVESTGGDTGYGDLDAFEIANLSMFAASRGNRCARRYANDVGNAGYDDSQGYMNIGLYSYWSWCWPVNRRIIYNRASTYQSDGGANGDAGDPLAPAKFVMKWTGSITKWKGDVPDHGAAPGGVYPFIMHKEGHAHIFGPGRAEGPFPWHYEPIESPIDYPSSWLGNYAVNPIVHKYSGALFGNKSQYPIAATTYRLTEHWHTGSMTRNLPWCNELQPEPFVEMSEELATLKGISNGEEVLVTSARGSIRLKACVTKRFKPFNGVHQVGIIWHWGYMTLNPGPSGNVLTPFIGDANTRIQESKAFLVKIEKI